MYERLVNEYKAFKINRKEIKEFNLIEKNDQTIYYCNENMFDNLSEGIKNIKESTAIKGKFKDDKLKNSVCLAVKFSYNGTTDIGFFGINNFNSLKIGMGFLTNITSTNGINTISKISDDELILGVGSRIDAVYISKDKIFLINPHGKNTFEKTFLLESEYKKRAQRKAKELKKYRNQLSGIDQLENDYYGKDSKSTPMLDKMLTKLSSKEINQKLKEVITDPEKWKNRLEEIVEFKKDTNFEKKFQKLSINVGEGKLEYSKESVFPFLQVLSDRPKKSILLELNELGS